MKRILFTVFAGISLAAAAQNESKTASSKPWPFPCKEEAIAHYTACKVATPLQIDGLLDEPAWRNAKKSPEFVDIITGKKAAYSTRAAVLWDDDFLYLGYWIEEPRLQAKYTDYNSPIYYDNDVEFFIAGPDSYYEFEVNGYNTRYEVFFIWEDAYERGGFATDPQFARSKLTPFNGVGFTNHPRGKRLGNFNWQFPGLKTAVHHQGTVNDHADKDKGWTVEIALPWKGMEWLAKPDHRSLPPQDGDVWRIDFSRFNTYKKSSKDSGGWVWSPHGIWDSHIPECFPKIQFSHRRVKGS